MAQGTEGVDYVTTAEAIIDPERNRIVYVAGSRVPIDDAVKYGLVDKPATRAKKGPEENRAKKAGATRKAAAKKR